MRYKSHKRSLSNKLRLMHKYANAYRPMKLHNEELNDLYSSLSTVRAIKPRRMRWAGHVARRGDRRGYTGVWLGNLRKKRPLGRPRRRLEDNIKMNLQEVGCGGYGLDRSGSG
jgi:hypothetical protein